MGFDPDQYATPEDPIPAVTSIPESVVGLAPFGEMDADLDQALPTKTGFDQLDDIVYGLRKEELMVLAARPKIGKSTFVMNMLTHIAKSTGRHAAFFSMEMSESQVLERLIAGETGIPKNHLERGLVDEDIAVLYEHLPRVWALPILIDTTAKLSSKKIAQRVASALERYDLSVIAIDYLQLMDTNDKKESRARQLSEAMEDLKSLAKRAQVPLIVLSQINRKSTDDSGEEPQLEQLYESGGIEANADTVVILWRKKKEEKEAITNKRDVPTYARVAKNRHGAEDYMFYMLDGPRYKFWEPTP